MKCGQEHNCECADNAEHENATLKERLTEQARRVEELEDDRRRALKRADELTLDTQTCEEAVTALVSTTRVARADAERQRARADTSEAENTRLRSTVQAVIDDPVTRPEVRRMLERKLTATPTGKA